MPNPTHSDLHVSRALTDISLAHANDPANFASESIFPIVNVANRTDKFFEFDRDDWFRVAAENRAPGAEAPVGGYRVATQSYICDRVSLAIDIDDPSRANADPAVANLDADATMFLTENIRMKNDVDFQTNFFTTGLWDGASGSTDMTGQSNPTSTTINFLQWNDVASTPIEDIRGEMLSIQSNTGRKPNTLALGPQVWRHLGDHPDILDRIKYTERGIVTEDLLASLWGLERVVVLSATRNTGEQGSTSPSYGFIAGKAALLAYVAPSPGLRQPSAGYTFVWAGRPGAPTGGLAARIKRFRIERNESDRIEAEVWKDQKLTGSAYGAFFATATA